MSFRIVVENCIFRFQWRKDLRIHAYTSLMIDSWAPCHQTTRGRSIRSHALIVARVSPSATRWSIMFTFTPARRSTNVATARRHSVGNVVWPITCGLFTRPTSHTSVNVAQRDFLRPETWTDIWSVMRSWSRSSVQFATGRFLIALGWEIMAAFTPAPNRSVVCSAIKCLQRLKASTYIWRPCTVVVVIVVFLLHLWMFCCVMHVRGLLFWAVGLQHVLCISSQLKYILTT